MPGEASQASVPPEIGGLIKQLVVAYKAVLLYPAASTIPRESAEGTVRLLSEIFKTRSEIRFTVSKAGLSFEGAPVFSGQSAFTTFGRELYNRNVADVRFHAGVSEQDIITFLSVLKHDTAEVAAAGGFESQLWEQGVDSITVTEAVVHVRDSVDGDADVPLPAPDEVDAILAGIAAGQAREARTLVRFMSDPQAIGGYIDWSVASATSADEALSITDSRITELAHAAAAEDKSVRPDLYRAVAEAVMKLEPELRRALLVERLLPDARTDDAIASMLRQVDIDEACRVIAEGLRGGEASQKGMARAIRNLAFISMAGRDDVITAAGAALRTAGVAEADVGEILEQAAPNKLKVRQKSAPEVQSETPVDAIFKLMELAPVGEVREDDPALAELQREARTGITDGDIASALVTLVSVESREERFDPIMNVLEDALELLVKRGEFEAAADAADSLLRASKSEAVTEHQRSRIMKAVTYFTRADDIKLAAEALRVYPADSQEHRAAARLIRVLGARALDPLLEILAEEPDMTARRMLVDTISAMADSHVDELVSHLGDARWYFVRNVVSILGSTRRPSVLHHLERTIRHGDPRVRRETIRAVSGIGDRLSTEMLVAALQDSDAQNVRLASRYLGSRGEESAIPGLSDVVLGKGRGNRDIGPRIDAIEALVAISPGKALPVLESVAGRRSLLGSGKEREVRAAAQTAIARIRAGGES